MLDDTQGPTSDAAQIPATPDATAREARRTSIDGPGDRGSGTA
jgi:hypothetical protein